MTPEELKDLQVDKTVDARGTACPGPLLEAKKTIGTIDSGQIMEFYLQMKAQKKNLPKVGGTKKGHDFYWGVV